PSFHSDTDRPACAARTLPSIGAPAWRCPATGKAASAQCLQGQVHCFKARPRPDLRALAESEGTYCAADVVPPFLSCRGAPLFPSLFNRNSAEDHMDRRLFLTGLL